MKKVVAFLLCVLIFITPVTTFVKADVVIGDNDETIINENATILGRKLALLESFSDLALSGVTEFTISNTNDVDSYLDSLWEEIGDAIDSLSNGTGFTQISNDLKSKYFTNLVQYRDYINNRGDYLSHLLPSGNPTTNLLSTFFANNIFGKHSTLQNNLSLDTFKALSRYNRNVGPLPDFSFLSNINNLYLIHSNTGNLYNFFEFTESYAYGSTGGNPFYPKLRTAFAVNGGLSSSHINGIDTTTLTALLPLVTLNINDSDPNNVILTYNSNSAGSWWNNGASNTGYFWLTGVAHLMYTTSNVNNISIQNTFGGLSSCVNYIYDHFSNVDIYYNNEPWVLRDNTIYPSLDIDGFLEIYGNDYPVQYELQPNTKIDYDQLYQVIYNAIRDNLPISQGDINYYDSHDTIYSPTIINNYGEEEGDESDLIDTILDYAVIPKFDTSIAQPMRAALTNGVVIMQNSITNVIPNEILLILGACFFLLLFAVVINRMIK